MLEPGICISTPLKSKRFGARRGRPSEQFHQTRTSALFVWSRDTGVSRPVGWQYYLMYIAGYK